MNTPSAEANALVPDLEAEMQRLVFDKFDHADAWEVGSLLVAAAVARGAPVTIDIRRLGQLLFHHARPGTTADNDTWVERKSRTAFHYEESSWLVRQRFLGRGTTFEESSGLDPRQYAAHGGSVPIRVTGAGVIAVATVSGLPQREDHEMVVAILTDHVHARRL